MLMTQLSDLPSSLPNSSKASASAMLRRNLWIYGLGGLLVPFIGIKVIDLLLTVCGLV